MSAALDHLLLAGDELAKATASIGRADTISREEWPAIAQALLAIRRNLTALDLRLEGKA